MLRLQLRFVRGNELANVVRHIQQLQPLFLVQCHRKAAHAVDRRRKHVVRYIAVGQPRQGFGPGQRGELTLRIKRAFPPGTEKITRLYGRVSQLLRDDGVLLCETVEALPDA